MGGTVPPLQPRALRICSLDLVGGPSHNIMAPLSGLTLCLRRLLDPWILLQQRCYHPALPEHPPVPSPGLQQRCGCRHIQGSARAQGWQSSSPE